MITVTRLTLAGLVLVGAAACSDSSSPSASSDCKNLPTANSAAAMPAGLPAIDGQVLYEPSTQGKTQIVFGLIKTDDFVKVRDDYVTKLTGAGWKIDGTDQESVEAEAQFSKAAQSGTIKVEPLATCGGYVSIRYKLSS